jgi:hypothetical protein
MSGLDLDQPHPFPGRPWWYHPTGGRYVGRHRGEYAFWTEEHWRAPLVGLRQQVITVFAVDFGAGLRWTEGDGSPLFYQGMITIKVPVDQEDLAGPLSS